MDRERAGWTMRAGPAIAALAMALAACSNRALSFRPDGGQRDVADGAGDGAVHTQADTAAASPEAGAGATACWGDERDLLPACAEVTACVNHLISECTQTSECEFAFLAPLAASGSISMVVYVNCHEATGWALSEDRRTLRLLGAACDAARAQAPSRVMVKYVHSCIL